MERDTTILRGGFATYGQVVGILMIDSTIPRLPGDPGHAETFSYPVRYGVIEEFPFSDLVEIRYDNLDKVIRAALELQGEGVFFIVADCGLFAPFQEKISEALKIPFIGSSLSLVPLIRTFSAKHKKVGILTGDSTILKEEHLQAAGIDLGSVMVKGMENCEEFRKVVLERSMFLNPQAFRQGVLHASEELAVHRDNLSAVVLECTNLIAFRREIQTICRLPVFDLVSLMDFFVSGYRLKEYGSCYPPFLID